GYEPGELPNCSTPRHIHKPNTGAEGRRIDDPPLACHGVSPPSSSMSFCTALPSASFASAIATWSPLLSASLRAVSAFWASFSTCSLVASPLDPDSPES